MKLSKKDILTIPNILSFIRLLLIPFFIITYCKNRYYTASAIVLLSGVTDLADGFIARRFNMITDLGKLLDPVADKLTQGAVVFALIFRYKFLVLLFVLLAVKEISMAVNDYILFKKGLELEGAKWFGKLSTAVLYVVMVTLIGFPHISIGLVCALTVISGGFLLLSFILYMVTFSKMHKSVK